MTTMMWYY